jgi:hypothetical protein
VLDNLGNVRDWVDYRRKRFWALLLLAVYGIAGFFVLPAVLAGIAPDLARDNLQRELRTGDIRFNPFTLRLQIDDLAIIDEDQRDLFAVDTLVVNLELLGALLLTIDFAEITLERPKINLVRYAFADSNLSRVLDNYNAANPPPADPPPEDDEGGLGLHIGILQIIDGTFSVEDAVRADLFSTRITPINITVNDLSTREGVQGAEEIKLISENGVELTWSGTLDLVPLESEGRIEISGTPLPTLHRYFSEDLGFNLEHCCLEIGFDYRVEALPDGTLTAAVNDANVELSNLALSYKESGEPLLDLPLLKISGGNLSWPEQVVTVDEVLIQDAAVFAGLNADGTLTTDTLLLQNEPAPAAETVPPEQAAAEESAESEPWDVRLKAFRIAGLAVELTDRSLQTPGVVRVDPIDLTVSDISLADNSSWPVDLDIGFSPAGALAFDGALIALPEVNLDGKLRLDSLALSMAQPWVQEAARVGIDSGSIDLTAALTSTPTETLGLTGDIEVNELALTDTVKQERLVGWQKLRLDQLQLLLDANELSIASVSLEQPFARLNIAADGSTNFESLAAEETEAATPAAEPAEQTAEPMVVRVGKTEVNDGSVDFSDEALVLPFRVLISDFDGSVSTIDSTSSQPSRLDFKGQVGEFGLTKLTGDVSIMDPTVSTAVELDFRNLSMPTLTPYTAEFVGRRIDSGVLALDLTYEINNARLQGSNAIVLTDFALGDKVESENAVSLPLDLGVALLTDAKGVIDLDVKVSGDMNDPGFSAGGVILKAFANVITKAAAAPFKLLGGLVPGGEDSDLEAIEFEPGSADLAPPEREKLLQVASILGERPALSLQIDGGFNRDADMAALRNINLDNQLASMTGERPAPGEFNRAMLKAHEKLAKQLLPDLSLRELRAEFERQDPETGDSEFDELAYSVNLRERLAAVQPVDEQSLNVLAQQRREMMLAFLTSSSQLAETRYAAGNAVEAEINTDGWVRIPLVLTATP